MGGQCIEIQIKQPANAKAKPKTNKGNTTGGKKKHKPRLRPEKK